MRIGVLTGGGDVPGLNACVKAIVYGAAARDWSVVGIRRGWAGLLHLNPDEPTTLGSGTLELNRQNTRTIDRTGGTFLHTSRVNPSRVPISAVPAFLRHSSMAGERDLVDCTPHVLRVLDWLGIDSLIVLGGDATLAYARHLAAADVSIVGIPKTMDNDVFGTDYCLGFSTAVTRSIQFIHQIRSPAGSHERIAVVELFGQQCGETTLMASYLAGADRALIPEVPFDPTRVAELLSVDRKSNPSNYALVTISEGARPIDGAVSQSATSGRLLADTLSTFNGEEVFYQQVGYLIRSGAPDGLDLMVADNFATLALTLIEDGEQHPMVALQRGVYTSVSLQTTSSGRKRVDVPELYDPREYVPVVRQVKGKPMFLY